MSATNSKHGPKKVGTAKTALKASPFNMPLTLKKNTVSFIASPTKKSAMHGLAKKMIRIRVKIIRERSIYGLIASQAIYCIHKHIRYKQRKAGRLSRRTKEQSIDVQTNLFYWILHHT